MNSFNWKLRNFDLKKIKINEVGKYSMTRPYEANQIINIIIFNLKKLNIDPLKCIVTDCTSGVGGDSIHLSQYFKKVNSVDIVKENSDILYENCKTFDINNINIFTNNYFDIYKLLKQDVIYFDPPWGGVGYKNKDLIDITLDNKNINEIYNMLCNLTKFIFVKVPLNINLNNILYYDKYTIYNKKNKPTFYLLYLKI